MEEGAPETGQASLQSEVVSHLLAPSQGTLSTPLFGEDQEPQRGDWRAVIRNHQVPKTHREGHRRVQIIGDREEEDVVRSRTVKRTKGEPVRAQGHTQERAGSLALSTRSCSLACSTRARDPSVGKKSEPMGCQAWALPHRNALPLAGPCTGARCCYDSLGRLCAEMPEGGSPLLSGDSLSTPGTSAGASREKPSASSSSLNQNSSKDTNHFSATTTPFHLVPGPTLSLHKHLQTARHT